MTDDRVSWNPPSVRWTRLRCRFWRSRFWMRRTARSMSWPSKWSVWTRNWIGWGPSGLSIRIPLRWFSRAGSVVCAAWLRVMRLPSHAFCLLYVDVFVLRWRKSAVSVFWSNYRKISKGGPNVLSHRRHQMGWGKKFGHFSADDGYMGSSAQLFEHRLTCGESQKSDDAQNRDIIENKWA